MRCFVLAHQHERLAAVSRLGKPINRFVGHNISAMTFDRLFAIFRKEHRVVVITLAAKHVPVVETLRLTFEMPLANDGRFIAALLQQFWKCDL